MNRNTVATRLARTMTEAYEERKHETYGHVLFQLRVGWEIPPLIGRAFEPGD